MQMWMHTRSWKSLPVMHHCQIQSSYIRYTHTSMMYMHTFCGIHTTPRNKTKGAHCKKVCTFFMCTLYICPHPAAALWLACRPHKVHTLAGTFSPRFCVYISVCIQVLHCCRQNMRKSAHLYVYLKSPVLCIPLPPLFLSFFLFFFKKVHTLAGHYKWGPHLQKVHTYMYTLKQQAAAGSIYIKVHTYICI